MSPPPPPPPPKKDSSTYNSREMFKNSTKESRKIFSCSSCGFTDRFGRILSRRKRRGGRRGFGREATPWGPRLSPGWRPSRRKDNKAFGALLEAAAKPGRGRSRPLTYWDAADDSGRRSARRMRAEARLRCASCDGVRKDTSTSQPGRKPQTSAGTISAAVLEGPFPRRRAKRPPGPQRRASASHTRFAKLANFDFGEPKVGLRMKPDLVFIPATIKVPACFPNANAKMASLMNRAHVFQQSQKILHPNISLRKNTS